jgi:hypothetical protein
MPEVNLTLNRNPTTPFLTGGKTWHWLVLFGVPRLRGFDRLKAELQTSK